MPFTTKPEKPTTFQRDKLDKSAALAAPADESELIRRSREVAQAEARIEAAASTMPERKPDYILQEIKVDKHNTLRRYVKLSPSMCTLRGCGYDSARDHGFTGWDDPTLFRDQILPSGKTIGETLIGLLEYHVENAHRLEQSHLLTEDEYKAKRRAGGAGAFLAPARS